jgi:hypothetical protein
MYDWALSYELGAYTKKKNICGFPHNLSQRSSYFSGLPFIIMIVPFIA